jgi:hypothetical protein
MSFSLSSVRNSGLETSTIAWLWPPYLAAGKLTMLDGDPGGGKSLVTIDLAARLSRRLSLPDGHTPTAVYRTLFLNAEDEPGDTVLPRLRAADADLDQIFVPNGDALPQLPADLPRLEAAVREQGIDLLVVDSLSAFLPANMAGGEIAVRQVLAPLVQMAIRNGVAVLLVRHLVKRACAQTLYRGLGSIGIAGLARTVLLTERHPRDASCQVLTVIKSNLAAAPTPLPYRLIDRGGVGAVDWLDPAAVPADTGKLPPLRVETPGVVRATIWLLEALAAGPRPAAELLLAARADGIRERPLEQAKRQLKIASKVGWNDDGRRCWLWCPPEEEYESSLPPMEDLVMERMPKELSVAGRAVLERDQLSWAGKVLRGR